LEVFTVNQMEHVPEWKAAVEAFEADATKPNPYEIPKTGMSGCACHITTIDISYKECQNTTCGWTLQGKRQRRRQQAFLRSTT
jgi:hypothetical protein